MSRAFKLITLDVTNTLYKVSGTVGGHYGNIGRIYGLDVDETALDKAFRNHYKVFSKKYPNFGVGAQSTPQKWWTNLVTECFHTVGVSKKDDVILSKVASHLYLYFTTAACWEVLPGVVPALNDLKNMDIKMGIISNSDQRIVKILNNLALKHYFNFVVYSTEVEAEKPDHRIFDRALKLANVTAAEAVHVGDNIEKDYMAARNAGLASFLLSDSVPATVDANHVVCNLKDFVLKLKAL